MFEIKQKGQGLVEYALILVLVAIVVIAALMILGPIIGGVFVTTDNNKELLARAPIIGSQSTNPVPVIVQGDEDYYASEFPFGCTDYIVSSNQSIKAGTEYPFPEGIEIARVGEKRYQICNNIPGISGVNLYLYVTESPR